jgi:hypothetical protein
MVHEPDTEPRCLTCLGAGEIASDLGPEVCPDCQGDSRAPGRRELVEWRLRDIERVHAGPDHPCESDVRWLVFEVRRGREALLRILSRCQDEPQHPLAQELMYAINQALGLYETST